MVIVEQEHTVCGREFLSFVSVDDVSESSEHGRGDVSFLVGVWQ